MERLSERLAEAEAALAYREAVARDLDSRLAAHTLTLAAWITAMRAPE